MSVIITQPGGAGGGGVGGSGTANRLARWINASTLGNSLLSDDATNVTLTSGQLLLLDGTGAVPSLSFTNRPTTGFSTTTGGQVGCFNSVNGVIYSAFKIDALELKSTTGLGWSSGVSDNASTRDLILAREAAGQLRLEGASSGPGSLRLLSNSNGSFVRVTHVTESHTLALAATSDTTITTPANSIILGVVIRVTTAITGCDTLDVGVVGATTRYGTGIAVAAGTTNKSPGTTNPSIYGAATAIRFSAIGAPAVFAGGVVRVTITYLDLNAPTS